MPDKNATPETPSVRTRLMTAVETLAAAVLDAVDEAEAAQQAAEARAETAERRADVLAAVVDRAAEALALAAHPAPVVSVPPLDLMPIATGGRGGVSDPHASGVSEPATEPT